MKILKIGRGAHNDIVLGDPTISTNHAEITVDAQGVAWIKDLGSRNGTKVNGTNISTNTRLNPGDVVLLGAFRWDWLSAVNAASGKPAGAMAMSAANDLRQRVDYIPQFRNDPFLVLVLAFLTCGLYLIYWNIKVAQVFNAAASREIIPQSIAIFSGCCYPVNIYFYYLAGKEGLPKIYELTGEPGKDRSTMLMILGLLLPMVAAMIVQGDINKLYRQ
jgi:hypothetical protein